jgi:hypothetical protein
MSRKSKLSGKSKLLQISSLDQSSRREVFCVERQDHEAR